MLAGMTMRPAATSSRICSGERCGSRSATRRISGVTWPRRAYSNCVAGSKPLAYRTSIIDPSAWRNVTLGRLPMKHGVGCHSSTGVSFGTDFTDQSSGRKSHAVLSETGGIPAVSGLLKVSAPAAPGWMRGLFAKLPGVVTTSRPGSPPTGGRT